MPKSDPGRPWAKFGRRLICDVWQVMDYAGHNRHMRTLWRCYNVKLKIERVFSASDLRRMQRRYEQRGE